MKYRVLTAFLVLINIGAFAQIEIDKMERLLLDKKDSIGIPSYKCYINLSGDYYYNSNSITNKFVNSFGYQGDFITESMKDGESGRLKKSNRLGGDGSFFLNGVYKSKKLDYLFGLGERVVVGSKFSSDFFELVFRGNSSYAGQDADLKRTSMKLYNYQSLYIGIQKELKEGKFKVGGALSLIRGSNYQELKIKDAALYTEPSGQYIDYKGDISYSRIPYDSGSFFKGRGAGAGINLFFSMKSNKSTINFEVRDLGFIHWGTMKTYSGNSTFRYNGVIIDDLLGNGTSIVNTITMDSIASATGLGINTASKISMLPTVLHLNHVYSPNKKFTRTIGIRYMLIPGYIPRIYVRGTDYLGKGFTLVSMTSYGGFGRFDYELGLMKKFKNRFIVTVNLFAFEYLVLPGKSSGNGLNFGLTKLF